MELQNSNYVKPTQKESKFKKKLIMLISIRVNF